MAPRKHDRFENDPQYRQYRVEHFARKYGWCRIDNMTFARDGAILKINREFSMIETLLFHPKNGLTTLVRSGNLTNKKVELIFRNPRTHMGSSVRSEYK